VSAPEAHRTTKRALGVLARLHTKLSGNTRRLGVTTIALASSGSTTLIFNLVLVRVLPASSYGDVARTFSLGMAVAQLTMAGISPAIAREVAHAESDDRRFRRARGGIRLLVVACVVTSLLYLPLALTGLAPTTPLALLLGWALALVYAWYFGLKMILFVLGWPTRYAALELSSDVIFFITLAVLAVAAPAEGVLAFSLAYAIFLLVAMRMIRARASEREPLRIDRSLLRYTGWASLATYASVGRFAIAVSLAGAVANSVVAGRLAALLAIIMPFFLLPQAAAVLTFADVARARGAGGDSGHPVRLMCRVSAWVSAGIIPICCLFAHEIVRLAVGARYDSASLSFTVLIIGVAPQIASLPLGQALAAQGWVVANASCAIAGFVVMLAGIVLFVRHNGVLGGSIAFAASMIVTGVTVTYLGHRRFGIGWPEISGTLVAMVLGLGALLFSGFSLPVRGLTLAIVVIVVSILVKERSRLYPRIGSEYT